MARYPHHPEYDPDKQIDIVQLGACRDTLDAMLDGGEMLAPVERNMIRQARFVVDAAMEAAARRIAAQAKREKDADSPEMMTVTVRDRAAESPWGVGATDPVIRTIEIPRQCPRCGARRGDPKPFRQHEDGVWYTTDVWDNPCGHLDQYAAVLVEAGAR